MAGVSVEFMLMLGYALALALIVLLLELAAGHARRRSVGVRTGGFTYHPGATADACDSCTSKAACMDSSHGRQIEGNTLSDVESSMARFHRALSLTLLLLASLILVVELFRTGSPYPRVLLALALVMFCTFIARLSAKLSHSSQHSPVSSDARC